MIWITIGGLGGLYIGYKFIEPDGLMSWFMTLFIGAMLSILGIGLGCWLGALIGSAVHQEFGVVNQSQLIALADGSQLNGHFFLGSGSMNEEMVYFYYRKEGNGFKADKRNASRAVIFADEETSPYVRDYQAKFSNIFWYWVAIPLKEKPSEFHIPKGSILQNYTLDLKSKEQL